MRISSNTVHLLYPEREPVVRAYTSLLKRRGYRPRAPGSLPHYSETHDEAIFRRVLISAPEEHWITVVDQVFDEQSARRITSVAAALSTTLRCPALVFVVHDSDAFYYYLYHGGKLVDRYCSWPAWYSEEGPTRRARRAWKGSPQALIPFCVPGVTLAELKRILRDYSKDERGPADPPQWAEDVLLDLADCLGITDPVRTYAGYHAKRPGLFLAVPGERSIRIDQEAEKRDAPWDDFLHLEFMRR
ncbi:MAG: hypothetical protein FJX76_14465 [Armatimonadetes bacterium]|nr:hypothetical protein [Armatimonadota bacterium]